MGEQEKTPDTRPGPPQPFLVAVPPAVHLLPALQEAWPTPPSGHRAMHSIWTWAGPCGQGRRMDMQEDPRKNPHGLAQHPSRLPPPGRRWLLPATEKWAQG